MQTKPSSPYKQLGETDTGSSFWGGVIAGVVGTVVVGVVILFVYALIRWTCESAAPL